MVLRLKPVAVTSVGGPGTPGEKIGNQNMVEIRHSRLRITTREKDTYIAMYHISYLRQVRKL